MAPKKNNGRLKYGSSKSEIIDVLNKIQQRQWNDRYEFRKHIRNEVKKSLDKEFYERHNKRTQPACFDICSKDIYPIDSKKEYYSSQFYGSGKKRCLNCINICCIAIIVAALAIAVLQVIY